MLEKLSSDELIDAYKKRVNKFESFNLPYEFHVSNLVELNYFIFLLCLLP